MIIIKLIWLANDVIQQILIKVFNLHKEKGKRVKGNSKLLIKIHTVMSNINFYPQVPVLPLLYLIAVVNAFSMTLSGII